MTQHFLKTQRAKARAEADAAETSALWKQPLREKAESQLKGARHA